MKKIFIILSIALITLFGFSFTSCSKSIANTYELTSYTFIYKDTAYDLTQSLNGNVNMSIILNEDGTFENITTIQNAERFEIDLPGSGPLGFDEEKCYGKWYLTDNNLFLDIAEIHYDEEIEYLNNYAICYKFEDDKLILERKFYDYYDHSLTRTIVLIYEVK